jgi:hypothetical protein
MISLCDAVRGIVAAKRVTQGAISLEEGASNSRHDPVAVRSRCPHWALRIHDGDCLPLLAELATENSVRRLPDYILFAEPDRTPTTDRDVHLRVLICELKSSAAGAESGLRQVQLGKRLAEYLIRIALYAEKRTDEPNIYLSGLIVSPRLPMSMMPKGTTRPGATPPPGKYDEHSKMRIYWSPLGGEIHLESFFGRT